MRVLTAFKALRRSGIELQIRPGVSSWLWMHVYFFVIHAVRQWKLLIARNLIHPFTLTAGTRQTKYCG
jgi:hypothetical protein